MILSLHCLPFRLHRLYSMVEPHSSFFRVITTNFLGVWIFRKFTVLMQEDSAARFWGTDWNFCYDRTVSLGNGILCSHGTTIEPPRDKTNKVACAPSEDRSDWAVSPAKTQIRLGGCPGWSESSLGAHAILLVLSRSGSISFSSIPTGIGSLATHTHSNLCMTDQSKDIRIFNGREVRIKNSVTRVTVRHYEACLDAKQSNPEWRKF